MEAAEVEVIRPTAKARAAADGGFYDAVAERPCPMPPDRPWTPRLPAPRPARWGRLGLGPQGLSTDSTPLVAVSLARWGHATRAHLHNREPNIYI